MDTALRRLIWNPYKTKIVQVAYTMYLGQGVSEKLNYVYN